MAAERADQPIDKKRVITKASLQASKRQLLMLLAPQPLNRAMTP